MKISIIVPIYNRELYLEECLNSIINQTYSNIEIILINDGSTDGSNDIINKYKERDNRIIAYTQKNSGVSSARNKGIELANGEYITFVDSDDVISNYYIETMVLNLEKDALVICNMKEFKNNKISLDSLDNSDIANSVDVSFMVNKRMINTPCCKLYSKRIIDDNNISFDETISLGEDLLFNIYYIKHINKIIYHSAVLYYYRKSNSNSLSSKYYKDMRDIQIMLLSEFENNINCFDNVDDYKFGFIDSILGNELRNKDNCFIHNYINIKKMLKSDFIRSYIEKYKKSFTMLQYYSLKCNLYLMYKIFKRIQK